VRLDNKEGIHSRAPLSPAWEQSESAPARPRCANGLHYHGHAVMLIWTSPTPRMQSTTQKRKKEIPTKIRNHKKQERSEEKMSNVAFHTTPGALAQTVTEERLYCSERHLHSCQPHGLLLSYIKTIRKLGNV
jgi:hypothetical protein